MRTAKTFATATAMALCSFALSGASAAQDKPAQDKPEKLKQFQEAAQADGYLKAHKDVNDPKQILGGPLTVEITQDGGGVFASLPDKRKLDPHVFGTPEMPRWHGGSPGITGVPLGARESEGGEYTQMKEPSPFGDKYVTLPGASLELSMTDVTATDAANTEDTTQLKASWQDADGNTYEVRCCEKMLAHGLEFPTFGGVATNHILHGWSGMGTSLMPTIFTYGAFWGIGEVMKNGETLDKPRIVHGMLTEYARGEGYKLVMDEGVTPTRWHFHLMVPPVKPVPEETRFEHTAVKTGFTLPNGKELPFWHVMFESIEVNASRGE